MYTGVTVGSVLLTLLISFALMKGLFLPYPSLDQIEDNPLLAAINPRELDGTLAANIVLEGARELLKTQVVGPEAIAFDSEGRMYMSDTRGHILVSAPPYEIAHMYAHVGGIPLGLAFDADENLAVCIPYKGLYTIEKGSKKIAQLAAWIGTDSPVGKFTPVLFANAPVVGGDGVIYFTDTTDIPPSYTPARTWDLSKPYKLTMLQGGASGRLLAYHPESGETVVLVEGLYFPNGVALSEDESFLLVAESITYRLLRYWLKGPKAGELEVFAEDLPAAPDNINLSPRGTFWVAGALLPPPGLKLWRFQVVRWLLGWAPVFTPSFLARPDAEYGLVMEVDASGEIIRSFHSPKGPLVTSALEYDGKLYLGSLTTEYIRELDLSTV